MLFIEKKKLILLIFLALLPALQLYAYNPFGNDDESSFMPISYGIYGDFNSRYVWRGFTFSKANVIQPI